jgi:hypothetical protein
MEMIVCHDNDTILFFKINRSTIKDVGGRRQFIWRKKTKTGWSIWTSCLAMCLVLTIVNMIILHQRRFVFSLMSAATGGPQ